MAVTKILAVLCLLALAWTSPVMTPSAPVDDMALNLLTPCVAGEMSCAASKAAAEHRHNFAWNPHGQVDQKSTDPYIVVADDTAFSISSKFGIAFWQLWSANPGVTWYDLYPGQILQIPAATSPPSSSRCKDTSVISTTTVDDQASTSQVTTAPTSAITYVATSNTSTSATANTALATISTTIQETASTTPDTTVTYPESLTFFPANTTTLSESTTLSFDTTAFRTSGSTISTTGAFRGTGKTATSPRIAATTSSNSTKPPETTTRTSSISSRESRSTSTATASPFPTNISGLRFQILNSTNFYRYEHNATFLTWNVSLAAYAQSWAERCRFQHSQGPYGENLALGYPNVTTAVDGWGDERIQYVFGDDPTGFSEATGHFTQLVWKSTTSTGCAAVDCTGKNSLQGVLVVCEYFPPGNIVGHNNKFFKENVQAQVNNGSGFIPGGK